ncbi:MAG: carboxypeptidase-like regulatory domain-containing protein, partial [Burkholderiales bacterium]
ALASALAAGGAWAGSDSEPHEHNPDDGPAYFGFVKDASGVPVRDAKVSASYKKSNLTLVTRTNATGAYKVHGFRKDVSPEDVAISCSKDGYKQIRTFRYPVPKGKPVKAVETECRLQRQ